MAMDTTDAPQLIEHINKSLSFTPYVSCVSVIFPSLPPNIFTIKKMKRLIYIYIYCFQMSFENKTRSTKNNITNF
jgi:hypothetical protein